MPTIKLTTENALFNDNGSYTVIVNVQNKHMKGILYLFTIKSLFFNYEKAGKVSEEIETSETLYNKFFKHIFKNRKLTISQLDGNC